MERLNIQTSFPYNIRPFSLTKSSNIVFHLNMGGVTICNMHGKRDSCIRKELQCVTSKDKWQCYESSKKLTSTCICIYMHSLSLSLCIYVCVCVYYIHLFRMTRMNLNRRGNRWGEYFKILADNFPLHLHTCPYSVEFPQLWHLKYTMSQKNADTKAYNSWLWNFQNLGFRAKQKDMEEYMMKQYLF